MGPFDQKAEGEPKPCTPEHVLAICQIPFGKCPHGESDEKGEAESTRIQWLFMMKPSMVPRAITDQSAAVLEPSTRLANRPVNSRVADSPVCSHQTQRHRDAEVVVEKGKKGNGEDVRDRAVFR
jgi:hypothetical protein